MNRILPLLAALTLLFCACEKENNKCKIPTISALENSGTVNFSINGTPEHGFYELEYGANGFTPGSGTTVTSSGSYSATLSNGAYDVYVRGNCGSTIWSDWSNPVSFLIENGTPIATCEIPSNLEVVGSGALYDKYKFKWEYNSSAYPALYYEVEYGLTGFAQGTGTVVTTNLKYYDEGAFAANDVYDFYVRANCGANGWSDWSAAGSFFAAKNQYQCLAPTEINYTYDSYFKTITFTWDDNGEIEWESAMDIGPFNPDLHGVKQNITYRSVTYTYSDAFPSVDPYQFYVRAICTNGAKTAWFGPKIFDP